MPRKGSFHRIRVNMPVKDPSKVKVEFQEEPRRSHDDRKHGSSFAELRSLRATRSWNRNASHSTRFHTSMRNLKRTTMPVPRNGIISESQSDEDEDDEIFTPLNKRNRQRRHIIVTSEEPVPTTSRAHQTSVERSHVDSQEGIRRSTRQRKLKYENYSDSWIVGAQTLRGYPMFNSSENYSQDLSEQASRSPKPPDETEEGETEDNEENEDNEEIEGKKRQVMMRPRRNLRKDKETEEGGSSVKIKSENTTNNNTESGNGTGIFEDMYSRVKSRRPRATRVIYKIPTRSSNRIQRNMRQADPGSTGEEPSSSSEEEVEEKRVSRHSGRSREGRSVGVVMTQRSSGIKYHLRKTKPVVKPFQLQSAPSNRRSANVLRVLCDTVRRRRRRSSSTSSTSSSSEAMNHAGHSKVAGRGRPTKARRGLEKSIRGSGSGGKVPDGKTGLVHGGKTGRIADIDPVTLDTSIRFEHVGGLENHVRCLQEMVVFPMLYTEIFNKFNVKPPKGVLFHGPPGTGKTLLARALANECSQGSRKVSFFMRKGADCLCKWVGESERQLRLLFEQAYEMRPSIIFFDELDGLAPVRSSKQDQIHASIVSTLLALMDGLTDRGEIIVIGATNRIDAIDPALRRPGRFDRELFFPLPAKKERQEILRIHVDKWEQAPSPELLSYLAEQTSGYCGSDLRALCSEAVIQALRRRYPQIYKSSLKLLLNPDNVKVEKADFEKALQGIVSASSRVTIKPGRKLPKFIEPLLKVSLNELIKHTKTIFPHCTNQDVISFRLVDSPRLLITGSKVQISLLTAALLYHIEHCPVHTLDVSNLFSVSARAPEESIIQIFQEMRHLFPCVLFIPEINEFWEIIQPSVKAVLLSQLNNLDRTLPILVLATSSSKNVSKEIRGLFSSYHGDIFTASNPDSKSRENFFRPLILERSLKPPPKPKHEEEPLEELPIAPPPSPPKLSESQLKDLYDKEENTLRELRIFLRQICSKLANNKQFFMFTKPVDVEEVPDYLQIIEKPMDLETMMTKIDLHRYTCAQDFLNDIDLLCRNALEYNPDRDPADKLVRHRACYLRDTAYALIKAEMDSDFEEQCRSIRGAREQREKVQHSVKVAESFVPEFVHTKPLPETHPALAPDWYNRASSNSSNKATGSQSYQTLNSSANVLRKKMKRKCLWQKGIVKKKKAVKVEPTSLSGEENAGDSPPAKKFASVNNVAKKGSCSPTSPAISCIDASVATPLRHPTKAEKKEPCHIATSTPIHSNHRTRSSSRDHGISNCAAEEVLVNGYNGSSDEKEELDHKTNNTIIEVEDAVVISDENSECRSPVLLKKEAKVLTVSKTALSQLLTDVVQVTEEVESIEYLIYLYSQFHKIISLYIKETDRTNLVQDLHDELQRFERFFITREEDPEFNLDSSVHTILETSVAQHR